MARPKRVPHRPDAFQARGQKVALLIAARGKLIVACAVVAVAAFIIAVAVVTSGAADEDDAWTAYRRAGGEAKKLRRALAAYGSTEARPFVLYQLGRAELERPTVPRDPSVVTTGSAGDGARPPRAERPREKVESPGERKSRLRRAETALRELTDDYPKHALSAYGLSLLGLVLEEQERHTDAAAVLEKASKIATTRLDPKVQYDIGRNYVLAGKPAQARRFLERAAAAGGTVKDEYGREVTADWIENARYLLAQVGSGERTIPVPKPKKDEPPRKQDEQDEQDEQEGPKPPEGDAEGPGGPAMPEAQPKTDEGGEKRGPGGQ